jgi:Na+/H+-dicarboxylate symporter
MAWWFRLKLWKRIFIGLASGVVFGLAVMQLLGPDAGEALLLKVKVIGDIFIRLIRMLVTPLIFFTLVAGVVTLGDPRKLGSIGFKAFALFLFTTFLANLIGLGFGAVIQPGVGVDLGAAAPGTLVEAKPLAERFMGIIPENPFRALVEGDVLAIIFFAILLGVGILMAGEAGRPAAKFFEAAAEAILKVTHIVMELAPFGVFALIAYVAGVKGPETFHAILALTIAVYVGCALHMLLVYGVMVRVLAGLPLINFFRGILDAMMVAYSTSSSNATLPVTMRCVAENLGVKRSVAGAVLPLGATINMDGTSLYLGIVALFTAQALGYTVEPHHYPLIALTAALVSIGTPGIPSASLFMLAIVLEVFDVTPEHTALIVGFILPFDRILDMMRTVVNVTGDAAVATTVAKWEGELDEKVYRGRPAA